MIPNSQNPEYFVCNRVGNAAWCPHKIVHFPTFQSIFLQFPMPGENLEKIGCEFSSLNPPRWSKKFSRANSPVNDLYSPLWFKCVISHRAHIREHCTRFLPCPWVSSASPRSSAQFLTRPESRLAVQHSRFTPWSVWSSLWSRDEKIYGRELLMRVPWENSGAERRDGPAELSCLTAKLTCFV